MIGPGWAVRDWASYSVAFFGSEREARGALREGAELFMNTPRCWVRVFVAGQA